MNSIENLTPVDDNELLARFILWSRWIRSDGTVKHEAFIPFKQSLSVTRHIGLTQTDIGELGKAVAERRKSAILYGRADLFAKVVRKQRLQIEPTAVPRNHANITGWPLNEPEQKIIAIVLAANACFVRH